MDNSVYLDEDIPFVESGVYEIDEASGTTNTTTTAFTHGNIIPLNHQAHQFHDDSIWRTQVPARRGRRPKSAAVVITTTKEPKRRGRKPKQELKKSLSSNDNNNSNDILSQSTNDMNQNSQRRPNKRTKIEEQQQRTGKLSFSFSNSKSIIY